jgi:hypothetical protein
MSLGQSILATAALLVLTILVISANRMIVQSQQDEYRAIAVNQAGEIASAIIDEALSKQYDSYNPSTYVTDPNYFSDPGPNATEAYNVPLPDTFPFRSINWYNDFDDYDGYSRTVDTPTLKGYLAKCTVDYVQSSNFTKTTTTKGFFKRIVVTVEQSMYLEPPISFSAVKTY